MAELAIRAVGICEAITDFAATIDTELALPTLGIIGTGRTDIGETELAVGAIFVVAAIGGFAGSSEA